MPSWRNAVPPLAGGVAGLLVFASSLGMAVVDPRRFEWLMDGDWQIHFFGWHMFRRGPWAMPLGKTTLMGSPLGTSIGLTDSIPVVGIPLKLLDGILPATFQYIGIWLLACFVLQGVFAVLILRVLTPRPLLQIAGAALMVMSPPLGARVGHPALSAHWLLLAAIWLTMTSGGAPSRRFATGALLLAAIAAGTHPYLAAMVLAILGAALARQAIVTPSRTPAAILQGALVVGVSAFCWWQSGYFVVDGGSLQSTGIGEYSMNLLAPVLPLDGVALVPAWLPLATAGQYEGFMYLGAGMLFLAPIALALAVRRAAKATVAWPDPWQYAPVVLAALLLTMMALSPTVTAGPVTLLEYDESVWGPLRLFRASGRMFWPVYYVMVVAIIGAVSRLRNGVARTLLIAAVGIQGADCSVLYRTYHGVASRSWQPLTSRLWTAAAPHYSKLTFVPTNMCDSDPRIDYAPFGLFAGHYRLPVNAGLAARVDLERVSEYCGRYVADLVDGAIADDVLYVVRPDLVPKFVHAARVPVLCVPADRLAACVVAATYSRWQDAFSVIEEGLPPAADFEAFYRDLEEDYRVRMRRSAGTARGSAGDRVRLIVRYLGYRATGCTHDEAEHKTLSELGGATFLRLCARPSLDERRLPSSADTFRFRQGLEETLGRLGIATTDTYVDAEGEAAWLHEYARQRLTGRTHESATHEVLQSVLAASRH